MSEIQLKRYFYATMVDRIWFLIGSLILICSLNIYAQDSLVAVSGPFKVSDISNAIEETGKAIQIGKSKIQASGDLEEIQSNFDTLISHNRELASDTFIDGWRELNRTQLESKISRWERYQEYLSITSEKLSSVIDQHEKFSAVLNEYQSRWERTLNDNSESSSAEVIKDRILSILDHIEEERISLTKESEYSIILLDSLTNESFLITKQLTRLKEVRNLMKGNLFVKDSPSFSELLRQKTDTGTLSHQFSQSYKQAAKENSEFFDQNQVRFYLHILLLIGVIMLFYFLKNHMHNKNVEDNIELSFLNKCLRNPPLLAFIVVLTLTYWIYPDRPRLLMEQLLLLLILPSVVLLYNILKKEYRIAVVSIGILYLFEQLRQMSLGQELAERWLLLIESTLACVYAIYLSRPSSAIFQKNRLGFNIVKLFPLIPLVFLFVIYSNLTGSVLLSKILTSAIITGAAVAVVLYIFISVIEGFIEYILISNAKKWIRVIEFYSVKIKSWARVLLRIWATYTWFIVFLRLLQIQEAFFNWWEIVMSFGWQFGEIQLTVELIIEFLLIIVIFSFVANVVRSLLEVEFLSRFNLRKGVPMAIAVMTRYTILLLGFFMAVAAAGISLDKLGFLAGALGVGIGFGLQNVVGNFVSGLILIFERPIHVDDVIEADNVEGVVKELGIRASKIRTWDGAEVVVPNMDLISKRVTNWTLSDSNRRREQILKLEYGTDPNLVIKVVKNILDKNEEVLKEPSPLVLFLGYKEYSLDFRILYWLNGNLLVAGSEIALAIHNELKRNNIEIAIPKQRMIMHDESQMKKTISTKKNRQTDSSNKDDQSADKT